MKKRMTSMRRRLNREMKAFFRRPLAKPSREETARLAAGSRSAPISTPKLRRSDSPRVTQGATEGWALSVSMPGILPLPVAASRTRYVSADSATEPFVEREGRNADDRRPDERGPERRQEQEQQVKKQEGEGIGDERPEHVPVHGVYFVRGRFHCPTLSDGIAAILRVARW